MSYTINLRIFQTNPNNFFQVVEQTVWNFANGGTWTAANGELVLTMGGSGTSGTIRFFNADTGERFIVAIGVHNYKRWCDIVTGLNPPDTGVVMHQEWYGEKRSFMREKQTVSHNVASAKGTKFEIKYTVVDGNNLKANLIIG